MLTVDDWGENSAEKIHPRGGLGQILVSQPGFPVSQELGHEPAAQGAESALGAELGSELLAPNVGFSVFTLL